MTGIEILEMVVKCRVPRDELEDYIIKLRRGEERLPVPAGLTCKDAFDSLDSHECEAAVVRACYG